jgi:hypothetical protein
MRNTTLLAAVCAAVLIGCEPVSEPDATVPDPSLATSPFFGSASGTANTPAPGWLQNPDLFRTFSFAARIIDEYGTAEGQFEYHVHGLTWGRAEVICMTIDGNTAWIGGIYTQASNPNHVGDKKVFAVKDNGAGPNADPDQITYIYNGDPETFCTNTPGFGAEGWVDVEQGQIVVRGQ